ncbi:amino acid/amide ABC transporter membrane protein 1, HAAT family [Variovorax sp. HW608]|uniref:branched-chain amino acid ABC transporter permease n=1 Tax=Variovorax sp. HW608 TaxID=1034889 RepID=UPI0008201D0C|nr:branched-chain amino acid ABC transporter permease [Variovorax sp. HW608]SCK35287.1 amino acid/amide ABC transporter membrane protein 1, HAAT family [Variovorax sp. HW608]
MDNLTVLTEAPVFNLQLLVDGVLIGALFALAAYGMALVWGVLRIINIAQGEFVMLGGYVVVYAAAAGLPPLAAVPLAAIALYVLGWLLYRAVIWRVVDQDLFVSILATFGLSILLQQLANQLFGANVRSVDAGLPTLQLADGRVSVPGVKLLAFAVAVVLGVALALFLKRSRLGQAVRATAQNARAARILGIDTDRVYAATFALNAAICGAAGALVAMTWVIHPYLGLPYTVRAFAIVVVAGLGNLAGVIAAGAGLGIAEQYAGFLLGAEFQVAFMYVLLVVILIVRQLALRRRRLYLK